MVQMRRIHRYSPQEVLNRRQGLRTHFPNKYPLEWVNNVRLLCNLVTIENKALPLIGKSQNIWTNPRINFSVARG